MNCKQHRKPECTFVRFLRDLFRDVSFASSGRLLAQVLAVATVILLLLAVVGRGWAVVYSSGNGTVPGTQTWKEFLLAILGAIDATPEPGSASVVYSALVRLAGAIVVGGVLTSFLCALVARYGEMRLKGLLVPRLRDHFVVIGCEDVSAALIRGLLVPDIGGDLACWKPQDEGRTEESDIRSRKVLVCTSKDVERIRETLNSVLPKRAARQVVLSFGETEIEDASRRKDLFERLCLSDAKQIYIVGDTPESAGGDVGNASLATAIVEFLDQKGKANHVQRLIPVFVRTSSPDAFDLFRRTGFGHSDCSNADTSPRTFLRPFCPTEIKARTLFGSLVDGQGDSGAPDFTPLGHGMSIHLVVVGLSSMGESLVLEALRICHYPNGEPSSVTIVDPDPAVEERFHARHPTVRNAIKDIKIDFVAKRVQDESVRVWIRKEAQDESKLLTIAVCQDDPYSALSAALSLPEEVYWHKIVGTDKDVRGEYRNNAPRVLIFQPRYGDVTSAIGKGSERYSFVRPFGSEEDGFAVSRFHDFAAMYLNAVHAWQTEQKVFAGVPVPVRFDVEALADILCENGDRAIREFREFAFSRFLALRPEIRWANVYVSDFYGVVFRTIGIGAAGSTGVSTSQLIRENRKLFAECLTAFCGERSWAETEHNRWIADRALIGYRAPRPGTGETRDDVFLYHNDLVPFEDLPDKEKAKDDFSLGVIPVIMGLLGIRLERTNRHEKSFGNEA